VAPPSSQPSAATQEIDRVGTVAETTAFRRPRGVRPGHHVWLPARAPELTRRCCLRSTRPVNHAGLRVAPSGRRCCLSSPDAPGCDGGARGSDRSTRRIGSWPRPRPRPSLAWTWTRFSTEGHPQPASVFPTRRRFPCWRNNSRGHPPRGFRCGSINSRLPFCRRLRLSASTRIERAVRHQGPRAGADANGARRRAVRRNRAA